MSGSKEIDINSLYVIVLRETENEAIQEIDSNLYILISNFIGKLKREEYDNIEAKIKENLVNIITNLTSLLLNIRLEKAKSSENLENCKWAGDGIRTRDPKLGKGIHKDIDTY